MRNVTVTVPDKTYREVRAWCAQRDTCISHVVQAFLKDLPRLTQVRGFPLPGAPEPESLAEIYNSLQIEEIEMIREQIGEF
jgi:hypothetical protein